jgi:bacillithiol biosynthesis deacetylase BshB1
VMKHLDMGYSVGILDLTRGELGSRGNADLRAKEARLAADVMGVSIREQADMEDGFFELNRTNILKIVYFLRKYQPDIVLGNAPSDRHPDHGRAAKLISDACFYAGLPKVVTMDEGTEQLAWRPRSLYHYIQDRHLNPDFVVDITSYMDRKIEAIFAFASQFYNEDSDEPITPISQKNFIDALKGKNAVFGRSIGVDYAEGFINDRIPGVKDLFDMV